MMHGDGSRASLSLENEAKEPSPCISRKEFQEMFFKHLALTEREAVLILQRDFKTSIAVFDKIELEALEMADTITFAIVKQFPRKF